MKTEDKRQKLIECFEDTLKKSQNELRDISELSAMTSKVYKENFHCDNIKKKNALNALSDYDDKNKIIVCKDTSFEAAEKYIKFGRTAVLNFANPHNPGGGVKNGAVAQEECLCRSSNLYFCLSGKNVYDDYYLFNKKSGFNNYLFSDRLIYTKDIVVFKDDGLIPRELPENKRFAVDVITSAAPYVIPLVYIDEYKLKNTFKNRITNIFESAIDNEVYVLILGAFGCGAFGNPPDTVARAFKEAIEENEYFKYFKKIVFAIKAETIRGKENLLAFQNEFK